MSAAEELELVAAADLHGEEYFTFDVNFDGSEQTWHEGEAFMRLPDDANGNTYGDVIIQLMDGEDIITVSPDTPVMRYVR